MRGRQRMPTMQAPVASAAAVISATEEGRGGAGSIAFPWFPQAMAEGRGNTGVAPRLMQHGSRTHRRSAPSGIRAGMHCWLRR